MPIRPSERLRYPPDWPAISANRKARAGWRCEHCGVAHGAIGAWDPSGRWLPAFPVDEAGHMPSRGTRAWCGDGEGAAVERRVVLVILTVAHLDHTPENNLPHNLRALCQRCHLAHDRPHHRRVAAATRRAGMRTQDMFGEEGRAGGLPAPPGGAQRPGGRS